MKSCSFDWFSSPFPRRHLILTEGLKEAFKKRSLMFKDIKPLKDWRILPSLLLITNRAARKYNNKSTVADLFCLKQQFASENPELFCLFDSVFNHSIVSRQTQFASCMFRWVWKLRCFLEQPQVKEEHVYRAVSYPKLQMHTGKWHVSSSQPTILKLILSW